MNKVKQLKQELKSVGINKAIAGTGTAYGSPAVILRWDGDEEFYAGLDWSDPDSYAAKTLIARFADRNLKS